MANDSERETSLGRWAWGLQYATAFVLVLLLTSLLGHSQLFIGAPLAPRGLTAASLVQFLGYGAMLWILWLAARRAAIVLPEDGGWRSLARRLMMPLAAVLLIAIGYRVPLILLGPYLNEAVQAVYNWFFVVAITAAAVWLSVTAYRNVGLVIALITQLARAHPPWFHKEGHNPG